MLRFPLSALGCAVFLACPLPAMQAWTWTVDLPSSFAPVPYSQDFESLGPVLPSTLAVTGIDPATGTPDPQAWTNWGFQGPMTIPSSSGALHLELGLDPGAGGSHRVRSSLVIGLDGGGTTNLNLDFELNDLMATFDAADGIWVSENGHEWYPVRWGWTFPGDDGVWNAHREVFLNQTPVDTTGQFYLMFTNECQFPFAHGDGVAIDDIVVDDQDYPILVPAWLAAGQQSLLTMSNFSPDGIALIGYSITGPGPTSTAFGMVDMSPPIEVLGRARMNPLGNGDFQFFIPPRASGITLYGQAADLQTRELSNSFAAVIP